MGTVLRWVSNAVRGLRSFAYGSGKYRPRVGVALGGGFARGIAHIGVLHVLEEHAIPIDFIAGTSVGALIAAAYASGTSLDEMERQAAATRFRDFGRWTISTTGMASNERLEDFLARFTPARRFDEMRIPLAIAATDLMTGKPVHFTEGGLGPALRASCAYPGLFLPIEYSGCLLVDGFLTEAVPSAALREMGAKTVIAVHLDPGLLPAKPHHTIEVISRSFSVIPAGSRQPWRDDVNVLIEPDVCRIQWDDFAKTPQLVAAGRAATLAALHKIRTALSHRAIRRQRHPASARVPAL